MSVRAIIGSRRVDLTKVKSERGLKLKVRQLAGHAGRETHRLVLLDVKQ